jgi:hypothetical protein
LPTFMRHPGSCKPESIANEPSEIQIVDTHEALETRISIGFAARWHQMNRTLLAHCIKIVGISLAPVEAKYWIPIQ